MADVKNHNTKALPFGALLTKIFQHFRVSFRDQHNQFIDGDFTEHLISHGVSVDYTDKEENEEENEEEDEKGDGGNNQQPLEIENRSNIEELPSNSEETPPQEGPPAWFMEYFIRLNTTMERIEQQKEHFEKNQTQLKHIKSQLAYLSYHIHMPMDSSPLNTNPPSSPSPTF